MPGKSEVEEISLEFVRKRDAEDPHAFSFERQEYLIRHTYSDYRSAWFPWDDPGLRADLAELEKSNPNSSTLERLGHHLRKFLDTTSWVRDEDAIEKAWKARKPIHLTILSNAAELYYLPWELLPLKSSGTQLGELPDCLIRYEWPRSLPHETANAAGRILLACSSEGGSVPFDEHRRAILEACHGVTLSSRPQLEVLPNVNRQSLAQALNDASRPVDVLHVLCHGTRMRDGSYGLVFNPVDPDDGPDKLDATDIRRIFSTCARPPRLVVLCVCQSGDIGVPAQLLGGIAQMLHRQGIPAVIASRMPLSGKGSIRFAEVFYGELLRGDGNLRTALSVARTKLMHQAKSKDWASLQIYAREGDESALDPFRRSTPLPPVSATPRRDLVLICHEAYDKAHAAPEPEDAPALFAHRRVRKVVIDQTPALEKRQWKKLAAEVKRLASPKGELRRALSERDTELVYYGFPFIPLAALAGYLAKTRHVHVFEHDRQVGRFTWVREANGSFPPLTVETKGGGSGSSALIRLSISAPVRLEDCRAVLPELDVSSELHFTLETPQRGIVRREEQVHAYEQQLRKMLDQHVVGNPQIRSVHIFAAVPVSIAFRLGQALTATGLPACCVYNYGGEEQPRYKWRLWIQAAATGQDSVDVL